MKKNVSIVKSDGQSTKCIKPTLILMQFWVTKTL